MMEPHDDDAKGLGVAIVAVGAAACCALPLLIAAGVLGGLAGWFADGGWAWVGGGAVLAAVAFLLARGAADPGASDG